MMPAHAGDRETNEQRIGRLEGDVANLRDELKKINRQRDDKILGELADIKDMQKRLASAQGTGYTRIEILLEKLLKEKEKGKEKK
jgi:hypothetical protein